MKKIIISAAMALAMMSVTSSTFAEPALKPLRDAHKVKFDQMPQKVQDAAKQHLGSIRVEDVDKGKLNGKTVYELAYKRPKDPNHTYELRINEDGKLMGVHED
jgi:hypothetical protein